MDVYYWKGIHPCKKEPQVYKVDMQNKYHDQNQKHWQIKKPDTSSTNSSRSKWTKGN